MSAPRPTLRASPRKKSSALPKLSPRSQPVALPKEGAAALAPLGTRGTLKAPEEEADNAFGQGAIAGPSSPTRRRRRPSVSRRRSSSITAAAALISSYSTSPTKNAAGGSGINVRNEGDQDGDRDDEGDNDGEDDADAGYFGRSTKSTQRRRKLQKPRRDEEEDQEQSDEDFIGGAGEALYDAKKAFLHRRPSPYHMALVTLLFSLGQGMPLASQFKVYAFQMCRLYRARTGQDTTPNVVATLLPPAPNLPATKVCENVWVQNATSTYAAAMATVGALLSLVLLNRCSRLTDYFGRKPLLLLTQILIALSTIMFRISIVLPTYVGVTLLYVAVMILEASAGAPFRISMQNYVVDTTSEAQRAAALSFTDGFGQLGAFPSSTLGGFLAAATQKFFAPFYASTVVYSLTILYILLVVPESKKRHHHTLIDDFENFGQDSEANGNLDDPSGDVGRIDDDDDADTDGGIASASYFSSAPSSNERSYWTKWAKRINFLSPLAVFLPRQSGSNDELAGTHSRHRDWRLLLLAIIVIVEETFQVFLIPVLLLYNTEVYGYDVLQNGYLVSLLQGVRAVHLTIIFPWGVGKLRAWNKRRQERKARSNTPTGASTSERTPLLQENGVAHRDSAAAENPTSSSPVEVKEERGRLDITIMFFSYLLCAASFSLLAVSRSWVSDDKVNRGFMGKVPSWVFVAISIIGIQLGSGGTSLRTALLVTAVSEQEDEKEMMEQRERHQRDFTDRLSRRPSLRGLTFPSSSTLGTAHLHIHHDRHQSKALAAHQILCTVVYALIPLATSEIFGAGLRIDRPELVWIFKAGMAILSALVTLVLLLSYTHRESLQRKLNLFNPSAS